MIVIVRDFDLNRYQNEKESRAIRRKVMIIKIYKRSLFIET